MHMETIPFGIWKRNYSKKRFFCFSGFDVFY